MTAVTTVVDADTTGGRPMTDGDGSAARTLRTRVIAALVGLAVIVVLAVVVTRLASDDSEEPQGGASPSATPEPTDATPTDAPSPGEDTASPSQGATGGGGGGDPEEAPAPGEVDNRPPIQVSLGEEAQPTDALTLAVTQVEKITSRAELPGETSRPALRITVSATNSTDEPIDIGGALTNLYYGPDRLSATLVQRPGGRPFPATVPAGGTATTVVVYNVPERARGDVALEVSLDATVRRVEFSGDCSSSC